MQFQRNPLLSYLRATVILGCLVLIPASRPAWAAGVVCRQDCSAASCSQSMCVQVKPGSTGGSCRCNGAAEAWGGATFSSWCSTWGQPLSACAPPGPGVEPPAQVANASVLVQTLRNANPFVAALVNALRDGMRWADGPVQGLLHDSYYDAVQHRTSHTAALSFAGQAVLTGPDSAQVDITVAGDIRTLTRLKQYSDLATPSAVPPQQVHGTVTGGGAHGSLLVTGVNGASQSIQW